MAAALGPPSSKVSRTLPGFGLPHPVAGVFGAVVVGDLVVVGFGVAVAFGVVVGFGFALVVVVVLGVGLVVVVFGLEVVGGTDVTVTVGGAVLAGRSDEVDDELDAVGVPVGSSKGLTA